ncbi:hypothetical protein BC829DRAFT_143727 [Chytridium lagenaria]|nr:hypothetical protein BC829DRAFT_143727 [Chytridium lagenaria]
MKESPAKSQPLFFAAPPRLESPRPLDQFPKLLMQKQSSTTDSFPKALPVKEEFAVDLVTELVEEEVVSVVLSFLFEDNYARVFAERLEEETLYELCEELVKEVFTEIRQERKQEVLAAARHDAMTHQSRFFRRWLENAVRKAKVKQRELEKRQEKAVRYYLSVLGSDFASYHHSPATPRNMSRILGKDAITGFVDNGWGTGALTDFEGLLLQNIQEGSQRYDSFFRSIDVPNVILLPLMKVNNNNQASRLRHILWKLIISTPVRSSEC